MDQSRYSHHIRGVQLEFEKSNMKLDSYVGYPPSMTERISENFWTFKHLEALSETVFTVLLYIFSILGGPIPRIPCKTAGTFKPKKV